jgi:nucleoside-diphosphate-sugar epimerase
MSTDPLLVTGASGFLGRHVLQALQAARQPQRPETPAGGESRPSAIALVRDAEAWRGMEWTRELGEVEVLVGSVTEPEAWIESPRLERLGGIIHLAALVRHSRRRSAEVYRTNIEGTLALVRLAATRRCRIVFVSTSGTVGCFREPEAFADEDAPYREDLIARWPYYHSKLVAERRARSLADELGLDLVIVRPPVLLGPGDHRFRTTGHLLRYLRGRLPFLIRGGIHFADVRDVASALVRAGERPDVRPVYNLPGTACGIAEFFRLVEELSGIPATRRVLPFRMAWWLATLLRPLGVLPDPVVIEIASHYWDTRSRYAGTDLDYTHRDVRETLADTIAWLRANHPALAEGGMQ